MGEEPKQEQVNAKAEEKVEVKQEEKKEETKPDQSPFVLYVDLHCNGCAKKIERSIMKIRGVEGVAIDMAKNEVTIKGIVEPQAVCNKIMKKTKRRTKVLSPLPASEGEPIPQVVTSQVSGPVTVELNVNMHCEACAEQLKTKILRMRGVQTATTELSSGKVMVTGTMDANKLVEYVYRTTKKQARVVPQPEPEPEKKEETTTEEAKNPNNNDEAKKPEEKKEDEKPSEEEAKKEDNSNGESKEEIKSGGGEEEGMKKENGEENNIGVINPLVYLVDQEENMKRMMYYYQPLYMIDRIPPPQIFSDENPNACCIS